ncbi:CDP-alcohol phosphatidyltransferase family protein [Thermocrinis sp.]|uniref:CDP-alcohol phosphatidyltransferase family protein n=1 Tax=Thermocrinis sp. TaxID=2024383 RepID=UPI002FDD2999
MANYITFFRFLLTFLAVYAVLNEYSTLALLTILIGAVSDWLDGGIARRRKEVNRLGVLLDPFVDKVFVLSCLSAYLYLQEVSPYAFVLLLIRELYISFLRSLSVEKGYSMPASYVGKSKTAVEFITLILLALSNPISQSFLWLAVFLAYVSALDYTLRFLRL